MRGFGADRCGQTLFAVRFAAVLLQLFAVNSLIANVLDIPGTALALVCGHGGRYLLFE